MRLSTATKKLIEWHTTFGVDILNSPGMPSHDRRKLRLELIREEFEELTEAVEKEDIVEVADALADILYVVHGAALEFGVPLDDVFDEVHRSNMTKVWSDGTVHRREDGKVMKPPTYSPADVRKVLDRFNQGR